MPTISLKVDAATFGVFSTFAGWYNEELSDFVLVMAQNGFLCMFGEYVGIPDYKHDSLKNVSKQE